MELAGGATLLTMAVFVKHVGSGKTEHLKHFISLQVALGYEHLIHFNLAKVIL